MAEADATRAWVPLATAACVVLCAALASVEACVCIAVYDPVCADGVRYSNDCVARCELGEDAVLQGALPGGGCNNTGVFEGWPEVCDDDALDGDCGACLDAGCAWSAQSEDGDVGKCAFDCDPFLAPFAAACYVGEGVCPGDEPEKEGGRSCLLSDGVTEVPSGWSGNGVGDNWCNPCGCSDGGLICTLAFCEPVCSLPPETGMGRAAITKYYYDESTGMCEAFTYGGVGGNPNRFDTEEECLAFCKPGSSCLLSDGVTVVDNGFSGNDVGENWCNTCGCSDGGLFCTLLFCEPVCSLPPETGTGKAAFASYYFNETSSMCEEFTYGGVGGNPNRFDTEEECLDYCAPVCSLPPEMGPCRAAMDRFFFNETSGMCEMFTYGGCGGNMNNFESQLACQLICP